MPRPRPGYERPTSVDCLACGGPIDVAPAGRIPDRHAACARLAHDMRRAVDSLDAATEGRSPAELRALRAAWAEVQSGGNVVWNRVDNPARRGG